MDWSCLDGWWKIIYDYKVQLMFCVDLLYVSLLSTLKEACKYRPMTNIILFVHKITLIKVYHIMSPKEHSGTGIVCFYSHFGRVVKNFYPWRVNTLIIMCLYPSSIHNCNSRLRWSWSLSFSHSRNGNRAIIQYAKNTFLVFWKAVFAMPILHLI